MKILLLSRHSQLGASSRLRTYQYLPYLKACGVDVTTSFLLGDNYIKSIYTDRSKNWFSIFNAYIRRIGYLLKSYCFDLIWIEKELFPYLPALGETLLNCAGIPFVVDYDDAIYHNYDLHPNKLIRLLMGNKIDAVMKLANLVIAGNDYLAERAKQAGAKWVECLPTVIDLDRYHLTPQVENEVFTIGWIGSPGTAKYIYLIHPALSKVCKDGTAQLVLVGLEHIELEGVPVEIRSWSEKTEVANIQSFDVGIMPLQNGAWEQGKCGYKLIQYMACGKPIIASPVGVNQQIVEDGVNGFLAESTDNWISTLKVLQGNCTLRENMGRNGRIKVEKQYCLQVTCPHLLSLLKSVVKRSK